MFRVLVLVPVHPEGSIEDPAVRNVLYWHQRTIWKGDKSFFAQFSARFPLADAAQYVSFHSLRAFALHNGVPVTEQIYIHSKLMIVDE